MTIRVVVADDQALVRAGFADDPRRRSPTSRWSARPPTAPRRCDAAPRHAARTWCSWTSGCRELDGIEATRRILRRAPPTPPRVLMLTTFDLDDYVYAALRAGASGFLLKDAPPDAARRRGARRRGRESLLAPALTRRLVDRVRAGCRRRYGPTAARGADHRAGARACSRLLARGLVQR